MATATWHAAWMQTTSAFDESFRSAAGAAIIEFERGPGTYHVADVGHLGCLDHAGQGELDALADIQPEPGVEQPHAVAEQDRGDVQLELIQQPGRQDLAQQRASSGD